MALNVTGLGHGYEVFKMSQHKYQHGKNLTEEVVGGVLNKQMEHQQKMVKVNAQMQVGMNNMIQQESMVSLFV